MRREELYWTSWGLIPRDCIAHAAVIFSIFLRTVVLILFMLRSTVTTGSYMLEKYSRSYPPSNPAQTHSQDLTARQPEWQHFVHPVMTLTLDVKKSMDNSFESVRLRIIWNIDGGNDQMQREITMVRTEIDAYMRLSLGALFRKTSIFCHFQESIARSTLAKAPLSRPSIVVRSWESATSILFLYRLPRRPYVYRLICVGQLR